LPFARSAITIGSKIDVGRPDAEFVENTALWRERQMKIDAALKGRSTR
jgi:hypothetical protein